MPDFDIDFCMDRRDRVIDYVRRQVRPRPRLADHHLRHHGGEGRGARRRPRARHALRLRRRIAKLIPFELGITLDDALEKEPELKRLLRREDEELKNLIDLARTLEGLTRNAGKHAGGVVIAPSPLTDFAPLYCDDRRRQRRHAVRQGRRRSGGPGQVRLPRPAHAHDHRLGGEASSTRAAPRRGEAPLDISALPLDDAATYELLQDAQAPPRCSSSNRAA